MSRKIDPKAFRVGITYDWISKWFASDDLYGRNVIEDDKIRSILGKKLRGAGLDKIVIERGIKSLKVTIYVARPGVVIGRKGAGLAEIREELKKITTTDIDLQIEEVKRPEANAKVISGAVANQIERRISAKRAVNIAADKAMEAGAKGVKIQVNGTIYGPNSIAMSIQATRGSIPTQTLRANIDYAKSVAFTRGGTIGVKVWVHTGEAEL